MPSYPSDTRGTEINLFERFKSGCSIVTMAMMIFAMAFLAAATPCRADEKAVPVPENVRIAITRGLHWLAKSQKPDGHFASSPQDTSAVTSLAVMAFLARGYTPQVGPYAHVIDQAITWILSIQQKNGYLAPRGGTMYDHGISTVMLTECYGLLHGPLHRKVGQAIGHAVALILAAQKKSQAQFAGGWRYQPWSRDADISCTGWQLMALRGAADSGASVPASTIKKGIAFVLRDACPNGGFSYQPGGPPGQARTGTGIVALELLGKRNTPQAVSGGDFLLAHPINFNSQFFFYSVYYCSQAANQLGGRYWRGIYPHIQSQLLQHQTRDGSWASHPGIEGQGGQAYTTAMAILSLCVPFHYLPLYQR